MFAVTLISPNCTNSVVFALFGIQVRSDLEIIQIRWPFKACYDVISNSKDRVMNKVFRNINTQLNLSQRWVSEQRKHLRRSCTNLFASLFTSILLFPSYLLNKHYTLQSHYRPGQALRVPRSWDFQISRQPAHGGGKVVSLTHRPLLPSKKYSWYSFLLEAELTPGPYCGRKDCVNENFQWNHRKSNPRPAGLYRSTSTNCATGCLTAHRL